MTHAENQPMPESDGKKVLNSLLKHVVTFTGSCIVMPWKKQHFNFSGFLMSIDDHWFMMTTGHILKDLDPLLASG